jgi:hypothetical protein
MSPRLSNSQGMAGLRIAVGLLILIFAQYKVFGTEFTLHGGFQYWINLFLKDGAYPFMVGVSRSWLRTANWRLALHSSLDSGCERRASSVRSS